MSPETPSTRTPTVSAIIPAYNEATRIAAVIQAASEFVDEVLVVDDASTDTTAVVAKQAGTRVVTLEKNRGYIGAIKAGFAHARGDICITLDADGEFDCSYIPALVAPIVENRADMVQGHRDHIPRPSERFLNWLAAKKGAVGDSGTGLRAIRTELAKTLEIRGNCICGVLALEVLAKGGRIAEIPISLNKTAKPRRIAWFHLGQLFHLLRWLLRPGERADTGTSLR